MYSRPTSGYNPPPAVTNDTLAVDPGVTSLADLANVSTINLTPPVMKLWVNYATGKTQSSLLLAEDGGLHPADWNALLPKSWFTTAT